MLMKGKGGLGTEIGIRWDGKGGKERAGGGDGNRARRRQQDIEGGTRSECSQTLKIQTVMQKHLKRGSSHLP